MPILSQEDLKPWAVISCGHRLFEVVGVDDGRVELENVATLHHMTIPVGQIDRDWHLIRPAPTTLTDTDAL